MIAVEWLTDKFYANEGIMKSEWLEKAKEIEKDQMLNTFQESRLTHSMIGFKHETFADYYNETFKS